MTGEKVARRVMAYDKDVKELELQMALADDVALRITGSIGGMPAGSGGHSDKPSFIAARKDELKKAMQARSRCRDAELAEAARLIGAIPWLACCDVMRRTCFSKDSLRQIAASLRQSEESVRSLRRRGWGALAGMTSALEQDETYMADRRVFERAIRKRNADA